MLHFWCKNCGKTFRSGEDHAGKKWTCPQCQNVSTIPVPKSVAPVAKPKHAPAGTPKPSKPQPKPSKPQSKSSKQRPKSTKQRRKGSKQHSKSPPKTPAASGAKPVPAAKAPAPAVVRTARRKSVSGASSSTKAPAGKPPSKPKGASKGNTAHAHPAKKQRQCSYTPPANVGFFGRIPKFVYISGAAVILTVASLLYFFLQ
jgi:phage FluMu protein Com/cobalamin biosynthesis Mg chelatase CobN